MVVWLHPPLDFFQLLLYNISMKTIDQLLLELCSKTDPVVSELIPRVDAKLLHSLAYHVNKDFITENQSKLILKILNQYSEQLSLSITDLPIWLSNPMWSRPFRVLAQYRTIKLINDEIIIEISHNPMLRSILGELSRDRKSTRLNSSHIPLSRMPSSA